MPLETNASGRRRKERNAVTSPSEPNVAEALPSTVMLLLEIAERLFAENGVEAVSLSRIVEEGGQRNRSALHYHFGSRSGLVAQLLHMRLSYVNAIRHQYLDRLQQKGEAGDVHAILHAAMQPIFDVVQQEPWGIYYVPVLAQTTLSPALKGFETIDHGARDALTRTFDLIRAALPDIPAPCIQTRFTFTMDTVIFTLARALRESGREGVTNALLGQLVDYGTAGISSPVTRGTRRKGSSRAHAAKQSKHVAENRDVFAMPKEGST